MIPEFKPWKTYSIESDDHTWGYIIYVPIVDYFEKTDIRFSFKGWVLYPDDSRLSAGDGIYGKFTEFVNDDESEEVYVDSYRSAKEVLNAAEYYQKRQMIRDVFEKDINDHAN